MKETNVEDIIQILLTVQKMNEIILDVPSIPIEFSKNIFKTLSKTTIACTIIERDSKDGSISSKKIYIKKCKIKSIDEILKYITTISHEMRHHYQAINGNFNLDKYSDSGQSKTLNDYNLQSEEIDAHAYQNLFMDEFFRVVPVMPSLNEFVLDEIRVRENLIQDSFYDKIDKNGEALDRLFESLLIQIKVFDE